MMPAAINTHKKVHNIKAKAQMLPKAHALQTYKLPPEKTIKSRANKHTMIKLSGFVAAWPHSTPPLKGGIRSQDASIIIKRMGRIGKKGTLRLNKTIYSFNLHQLW